MIGQTLAHYKILEKIGAGGMGEVYTARDTRLERTVALKFLSRDVTRDASARPRFIQEAKAASALDHSNICTIYDIGEADGQLYLVMAYYEGGTLHEKMERELLAIEDALDIAIEIAEGLADAHAAGIVHRDIKPANVMFSIGGVVKIVDFGLAKLVGASRLKERLTQTGMTVGTVFYMSPEQARGEAVDQRSDIWSLGVVLYEMVTGRLPFEGNSAAAILSAILERPPPPLTAARPGAPLELERIINRTLAKDAGDRYQTISDLRSELRQVNRASSAATAARTGQGPATVKPGAWRLGSAAAALVGVAGFASFLLLSQESSGPTVLQLFNPVQVTSALGVATKPSWSPDGRTLTYQSNQSGNWDVWVAQVSGGPPVNRTADNEGNDLQPRWSPDGSQIAFLSARGGYGCFVMSALGGDRPRRVTSADVLGAAAVAWSAEGRELACAVVDNDGPFIEVTTLQTSEVRRLRLQHAGGFDLRWSPDGGFFAYVKASTLEDEVTQLWVMGVADEEAIPVTDGRSIDWSPSWSSDGRSLFFVSDRGGRMDLWRQQLSEEGTPAGPPEPVTTAIGMRSASWSRDGRKLAYSTGSRLANLWRVAILDDRVATWNDAEQLTFDQALIESVDVSPDGQSLAFSSDRAGNQDDLWTLSLTDGTLRQLTSSPTPDWGPQWSPDGQSLAFFAYRSGNRDIWVMPAAGGPARRITTDESPDRVPAWSPDGSRLAFQSFRGGFSKLSTVAVDGGEETAVETPGLATMPIWSADGESLIYVGPGEAGVNQLWETPVKSGAEPQPLTRGTEAHVSRVTLAPDGQVLYLVADSTGAGAGNLWSIPTKGGELRQRTDLRGRRGGFASFALATDGKYLYFAWYEALGDIWTLDVVADESE